KLKLPSHNNTLQFIKELEKEEWKPFDGNNIDEYTLNMHKQMTNICQYYSSFFVATPHVNPFDFKFFRVRRCDQIKNETLRCEYSYPPLSYTTKNLRANLIGAPA